MPKGKLREWVCPECRTQFYAKTTTDPEGKKKGPGKLCPNGHWTPNWRLIRFQDHPYPGETQDSILTKMRHFGIYGMIESLEVTVRALLGSYESALRSLPEGSAARGIVEGSFKHTAIMARKVLEYEARTRKG